jgi:hypothetical protein
MDVIIIGDEAKEALLVLLSLVVSVSIFLLLKG